MSRYVSTIGKTSLAVAICDRCSRKFPAVDLMSDPNSPGLRVCAADRDWLDPYKKGFRRPDKITVNHPRPDVFIGTNGAAPSSGSSYGVAGYGIAGSLTPDNLPI